MKTAVGLRATLPKHATSAMYTTRATRENAISSGRELAERHPVAMRNRSNAFIFGRRDEWRRSTRSSDSFSIVNKMNPVIRGRRVSYLRGRSRRCRGRSFRAHRRLACGAEKHFREGKEISLFLSLPKSTSLSLSLSPRISPCASDRRGGRIETKSGS